MFGQKVEWQTEDGVEARANALVELNDFDGISILLQKHPNDDPVGGEMQNEKSRYGQQPFRLVHGYGCSFIALFFIIRIIPNSFGYKSVV